MSLHSRMGSSLGHSWEFEHGNMTTLRGNHTDYSVDKMLLFRSVAVWVMIVGTALFGCIVTAFYKRRRDRAHALAAQFALRHALRMRADRQSDAALVTDADTEAPPPPPPLSDYEMLTINVALALTPGYTPQYNPPSYTEAVRAPRPREREEPPPPYSTDGTGTRVQQAGSTS